MRLHIVAAALLALALPAHAVDIEIKGIKVDEPADCRDIGALELRSGTFCARLDSPTLMLIGEAFGVASKAERTRKAVQGAGNL